MKVIKYTTQEKWLEDREGCISGSKLGSIYAPRGGKKVGFYQLIADRLAIVEQGNEDPRDRGHRLEDEAVALAGQQLDIKLEPSKDIWVSELNKNITVSPDGHNKDMTIGVEAKCLGAALHLWAAIEDTVKVGKDGGKFKLQAIQYFVVNPELKTLFFVFYNPSVTSLPLHIIEMNRSELLDDVEFWLDYEQATLKEVDEIVERLAF